MLLCYHFAIVKMVYIIGISAAHLINTEVLQYAMILVNINSDWLIFDWLYFRLFTTEIDVNDVLKSFFYGKIT